MEESPEGGVVLLVGLLSSFPWVLLKALLAGSKCLNFFRKPRHTRREERMVDRLMEAAVVPKALTGWRLSRSACRLSLSISSLRVTGKSSSVRACCFNL